jgi:ATP-dependent Clp protease ATP-binding subunit ClpC
MGQYNHPLSVSELVGAERGIFGAEEGGKLTNAVRQQPYSVILLDELEKADPAVWYFFLPIFDEGTIEDPLGRTIDFRNTVIIATSNVGSRRFGGSTIPGFIVPKTGVSDRVREDAEDLWPPEFLNRFDEILVFNALDKDAIRAIVRQRIREVVLVHVDLDDGAFEYLVGQSYDPAMGARPVRRAIQKLVANPLSVMMANDEIAEGDTVRGAMADGKLVFTKA